jgi:hypothetical protein
MRIDEIRRTGPTKAENKKNKNSSAGAGDFDKLLESDSSSEAEESQESSPTSAASPANPFLALQEIEDREGEKEEFRQYSRQVLKSLEEVKWGLLEGELNLSHIKELKVMLENKAKNFTDPKIKEVCEELQLRAAVEIAKYETNS